MWFHCFCSFYWRQKVRHTFHFSFLTDLATLQYLQSTFCSFSKARATSIVYVRNLLKKIEIKMYNIHLIYNIIFLFFYRGKNTKCKKWD